ncbi:amidohydrolase family protein [candidate division KSB1 bacterium]|nr:amidohydrolase family protein [candidate division KSB1 bacterium]
MKNKSNLARRDFFSQTAKIAVAASTVGLAVKTGKADPGETKSEFKKPAFIIDSHIHCGGSEEWVEDMVRIYRPNKAMACVLTWRQDMELMIDAIKQYPDLFIGYGRVNLDDRNSVREIEEFKKNGFVGMKFHSPQKNYDDPSYFQNYRLCEEYGLHMIFHTGISSHKIMDEPQWGSSSRMRPMYLDTICRQFPRITVQGAHLGNPWYEEAAEAARWNPTLFFDVTGSTLLKFIKLGRLERMSEILWWADDESENNPHTLKGGPGAWEHIVFGTDEKPTGLEANIQRFQNMLDANNVPDNVRKKMWGLTIAEILGIDPVTRKMKKS